MAFNKQLSTFDLNLPLTQRVDNVWLSIGQGDNDTVRKIASRFYFRRADGHAESILVQVNLKTVCCILNNLGITYRRELDENDVSGSVRNEFEETTSNYCPSDKVIATDLISPVKDSIIYKMRMPDGRKYILTVRAFNTAFMNFQLQPSLVNPQIPATKEGTTCLPITEDETVYLQSDEFTNDVMIGSRMRSLLGTPQICEYIEAGICFVKPNSDQRGDSKLGVVVKEHTDLGSLDKIASFESISNLRQVINYTFPDGRTESVFALKSQEADGILRQLVGLYRELQTRFVFRHNDAHAANVILQNRPTSGSLAGVSFSSQLTAQLTNFQYAAASFPTTSQKKVRCYYGSTSATVYQSVFSFKPKIGTLGTEPYFVMDDLLKFTTLTYVRSSGRPYYAALDLYTMLVSLFMIKDFWIHVLTNLRFRSHYWTPLWYPEDSSEMMRRINKVHEKNLAPTYSTIIGLLRGVKLFCRLPQILVDQLA